MTLCVVHRKVITLHIQQKQTHHNNFIELWRKTSEKTQKRKDTAKKKKINFSQLDKVIFSLGFLDHIQLKRGVYRAVTSFFFCSHNFPLLTSKNESLHPAIIPIAKNKYTKMRNASASIGYIHPSIHSIILSPWPTFPPPLSRSPR